MTEKFIIIQTHFKKTASINIRYGKNDDKNKEIKLKNADDILHTHTCVLKKKIYAFAFVFVP